MSEAYEKHASLHTSLLRFGARNFAATEHGRMLSMSNLLMSCIVCTSRSSFLNDTLHEVSTFLSNSVCSVKVELLVEKLGILTIHAMKRMSRKSAITLTRMIVSWQLNSYSLSKRLSRQPSAAPMLTHYLTIGADCVTLDVEKRMSRRRNMQQSTDARKHRNG